MDPRDAWNYGVTRRRASRARRVRGGVCGLRSHGPLRPGPAAYARVAYALELKGDLDGALENMRWRPTAPARTMPKGRRGTTRSSGICCCNRDGSATPGASSSARRSRFPIIHTRWPAWRGSRSAEGDLAGALRLRAAVRPGADAGAGVRDRRSAREAGHRARSGRADVRRGPSDWSATGWATEEPQPQALARFLAERDRDIPDAVRLAEEAAAKRRDMHTMDALAWAYFKAAGWTTRAGPAMRPCELAHGMRGFCITRRRFAGRPATTPAPRRSSIERRRLCLTSR